MIALLKDGQEIGYAQVIIWNKTQIGRPIKKGYYTIEVSDQLPKEVYLGFPTEIVDSLTVSPSKTIVWPNGTKLTSSEIIDILKRKDVFYIDKEKFIIIYEGKWEPDYWIDADDCVGPYYSTVVYEQSAPIHTIE